MIPLFKKSALQNGQIQLRVTFWRGGGGEVIHRTVQFDLRRKQFLSKQFQYASILPYLSFNSSSPKARQ
ncbi:hypothetical protein Y032_0956g3208 [Ancylostoma ceylanicum]|nr:hypothetical protein Y032_0956g3208 [Ancylostoma ceylanicum]